MATPTAYQPAVSGYPRAGSNSGAAGNQRTAFDNLIRRELKVGDPNDPDQIARALADRYQGDTRAQAIGGEAQGLPFLNTPSLPAPTATAPTATSLDLDQAKDDVNQDLQQLLRSNLTKDVRPEIEGWQQAIDALINDGVGEASRGLDAYSRDRTFAARRQLGEYARLARLIGALTPELNEDYRNLAQSLDEVSAVLLVLMGESLANAGFAGGRYLLQVPYSELQARRDAVLVALRNLSGGAQESLTQATWPRGLDAYRQIYSLLERRGQTDLRALLSETEIARAMDELIQVAGGGTTLGMRRIGATAWGPLNRFQRFVQITLNLVHPQSPALTGFQEALQLFIDGFANSGGFRLLRIARPTVLLYGLYGATTLTPADGRLIELVNRRGRLASTIDCLTRCMCDNKLVKAQIVLDKVLFDVDRAIDLYAIGEVDFGPPELRASAYGILIRAARQPALWSASAIDYLGSFDALAEQAGQSIKVDTQLDELETFLVPQPNDPDWESASASGWIGTQPPPALRAAIRHELITQVQTDHNWRPLVEQMSSGCVPIGDVFNNLERAMTRSKNVRLDMTGFGTLATFQHGALWLVDLGDFADHFAERAPRVPRDLETSWDELTSGDAGVFWKLRDKEGPFSNGGGGRGGAGAAPTAPSGKP